MEKIINILHLEDDNKDAELVQVMLESLDMACQITRVQTGDEFNKALHKEKFDVILADYRIPGYDGVSAMRLAQKLCADVPFIFVSGTLGEDAAIEGFTQGATDYVLKNKLSRLTSAIKRALCDSENKRKRKLAEEALRESERRYRDIFDNVVDGIYLLEVTENGLFRTIEVNPALERVTGIPRSQSIGKTQEEIVPEEVACLVNAKYRRCVEAGHPIEEEAELDLPSGRHVFHSTLIPAYDETGRIYRIIGISHDITEIKEAEEKLLLANTVIENSPTVLFKWIEAEGWPVSYVSENIRQFGYSSEELLSQSVLYIDLIHPDDRIRVTNGRTFHEKQGDSRYSMEYRIKTRNGDVRWVDDRTMTDRDINGNVICTQGIILDITERKLAEIATKELLLQTIEATARMVEKRDPYTSGHQRRVSELATLIAKEMGLDETTIEGIRIGGLIHDVGKIYIPAEILSRPGQLTDAEYQIIHTHPKIGYEIMEGIEAPWPIQKMILQHHERLDGSGYPMGLKEGELIIESRILAVADVVEAMASHRPYRPALGIDKALDEILSGRGRLFDSQAVDACIRLFREKGYSIK